MGLLTEAIEAHGASRRWGKVTRRRVVPLAPRGRALPGPTIVSIELASINLR